MECGVCGMIYDEEFMIPGKGYYGICFDCAKNLLWDIIDIAEKEDPKVVGDLVIEKIAKAKLIPLPLHA